MKRQDDDDRDFDTALLIVNASVYAMRANGLDDQTIVQALESVAAFHALENLDALYHAKILAVTARRLLELAPDADEREAIN